jgi:hypothetical protein
MVSLHDKSALINSTISDDTTHPDIKIGFSFNVKT